ncbi:hypothetical protein [Leptolyngbya sp. O-77]|nr:hypothetical protein [Leptolyngbya sp. O-77]BAU40529.1 hypothetical protein O77CONTIG1_00331 [Leptolyngbya sp. O-77]
MARHTTFENALQSLMAEALMHWSKHQLYLSLNTTVMWNCMYNLP